LVLEQVHFKIKNTIIAGDLAGLALIGAAFVFRIVRINNLALKGGVLNPSLRIKGFFYEVKGTDPPACRGRGNGLSMGTGLRIGMSR
jgi:hypothetical protein